jgi:hypothetical protein
MELTNLLYSAYKRIIQALRYIQFTDILIK